MAGSVPSNTNGTDSFFNVNKLVSDAVGTGALTDTQGAGLKRTNFLLDTSAALGAAGSLMEGFGKSSQIKQNALASAAFYQARAQQARSQGFISITEKRSANEKALGSFVVNRAAAGVTLSGSALDGYIEGVRKSGLDILAIDSQAKKTAILNEFIAENTLQQSKFGQFEAVSNAVGGAAISVLGAKYTEINLFNKFTQ